MELQLQNVGRIFVWEWAVKNVTTQLPGGTCLCLLGANGSGKSTLLNLMGGVMRPSQGTVRLNEQKLRFGATNVRRRMMLIHPDQAIMGQSPEEHLGAAISLYDCDHEGIEHEVEKWLTQFDLLGKLGAAPSNKKQKMSRGQLSKLWLTTLFVVRPDVWLLDEPHQCGLDAFGIETLEEQIREHCDAGGIVVFTSQWPPHARRLADQVLVLNKGEAAYQGGIDGISLRFGSNDPGLASIVRLLESQSVESVS